MATGKVSYFRPDKGFGFIIPDEGGIDVFVHINDCAADIEELRQGQRVRFDERPSPRHSGKIEALAVTLIG